MKKINSTRKSLGFALQELLLAVAVVAVLGIIGAGVYKSMRSNINAEDMGSKTVELVTEIQKNWRSAGDYTTLTPDGINKLSLIKPPIRFDGTNLVDAWGNVINLSGARGTFALTIGGATAPIAKEDCAAIANKMDIASIVRVGSSATAAAGVVSGGNLFKNGVTVDQTALLTGCNEASTVIAVQFR